MVTGRLLWIVVALAAVYWVGEALADSFLLSGGAFTSQLLPQDSHEIWTRGTVLILLATLGAYAQRALEKHRRAERALRESAGYTRSIIESSHDAFISMDTAGLITEWNSQAEATFGWPRSQVLGRTLADTIIPPQHRERHTRGLQRFLATGEGPVLNQRIEITACHRDGREFPVELAVWPIRSGGAWTFHAFIHDITERKQAENALQESERRFRSTLDGMMEGCQIIGRDWRYLYVNDAVAAQGRRSREDLLGHRMMECYPGIEDTEMFAQLRRCMDERIPHRMQNDFAYPDGTIGHFQLSIQPVPEGIFILSLDITEASRAQEALRASEEKYRRIFENVQEIIYQTDPDGTIVEISPSVDRYGYRREDLIGTQVLDFYEDPEQRRHLLSALQERGEVIGYEARLKTAGGGVAEALVSAHLVHDDGGEVTGVEGVINDISERKRAEQALRLQSTALESAANAIVITERDGRITWVNPAFTRLTGYAVEEAIGQTPRLLKSGVQNGAFYRDLWDTILSGRVWRGEVVNRRKDGCIYTEEMTITPVRDERGETAHFVAIKQDITERKRMEERLLEQARRDALTGVLNHGTIVTEMSTLLSDAAGAVSHAVAMVDVDGLKAVNDTHGHQVGDAVLVAIARALTRDEALVGRYGGDEFVAVLRDTDRRGAERYRDAVSGALAGAAVTDPETHERVPVAASIGLAVYPAEADTIAGLIRLADSAMYATRRQRPVRPAAIREAPSFSDDAAEIVAQIVPLLAAVDDLDDKLRLVAQRISAGAGYDAVSIDVFNQRRGPPVARTAAADVDDSVVEKWRGEQRPAEEDPFVQTLLRVRRGIIVDDPQNDARLTDAQREVLRAAELRSAAVVPLLLDDDLIGIISAASKREGAFSPRDVQLLSTVAIQVTAIVRMATLLQDLRSSSDRIAQARTETVMLLAASAEAHDRTTGLHLQGVRALTEALALALGQSPEDAHELGLAAVLHDIGKVRVPDSILSHTGDLAEEDWELMKHHSTWGEKFLAGRPGFDLAACIARSHHERWDGTGYPDGLAGEEIPPPARIVAVADALDAMTSDRPYRRARPLATALQEIASCSGSQFSPDVVAALLRLHQRGELPAVSSDEAERPEAA